MSSVHAITEQTTLEQLATPVCSALSESDISVVLSGGAAVSIYSENEYESYDLDFVPTTLSVTRAATIDRVAPGSGTSVKVAQVRTSPSQRDVVSSPGNHVPS